MNIQETYKRKKEAFEKIKLVDQTIRREGILSTLKFDIYQGDFGLKPAEKYLEHLDTLRGCIDNLKGCIEFLQER